MNLSKKLISLFVKNTKGNNKTITKKETFVQGTMVKNDNGIYCVKIDGSDILTPATVTTNVNVNQPVTVMIKNHSATVIGNTSTVEDIVDNTGILNSTTTDVNVSSISVYDIEDLWMDYYE